MSWEEWTDARRQSGDISNAHQGGRRAAGTNLPPFFIGVGFIQDADLTLSICLRCRDGRETRDTDLDQRGGRRLARAVAAAFDESEAARLGVQLRSVNCMSQCKRPCTIALSGRDRFTYLFGDFDPETNVSDLLSVAASYAMSETGFLLRPDRPEVMQAGILGRIPPLEFSGELVEPHIPSSPTNTEEKETP